jgi:hypothetical protein
MSPTPGPRVPESELTANNGVSRIAPLDAIWRFNLPNNVKNDMFLGNSEFFIAAVNADLYNPDADLTGNISGQLAQAWWFPQQRAPSASINKLRRDLALGDTPAYAQGAIRFDFSPADAMASLDLHKPTAFDGMPFDEFIVDEANTWGTTAGGVPEAVAPEIGIQKATRRTPVRGPRNDAKLTELLTTKFQAKVAEAHPDAQAAIRDAITNANAAVRAELFRATDFATVKPRLLADPTLTDMAERPLMVGAWGTTNVGRAQTAVRGALSQLGQTEANLPGDAAAKNVATYVENRKGQFSRAGTYDRSRGALKDNIWSAALNSQAEGALLQDFKDRLGDGHDLYAIDEASVQYSPCSEGSGGKQPPPAGTAYTLSYRTMNGQSFTAQIAASGVTSSIESNNLNLKSVGGPQQRANTVEDSGSFRTNEAQHRAHLIADEFRGSGFRGSANVASTSGIYNADVRPDATMRWAELQIGNWIRDEGQSFGVPEEFSLSVSVTWGDLGDQDEKFRQAVRANASFLRNERNEDAATPSAADVDRDVQAYKRRHATTKLQRVKSVTYTARMKLADGSFSPPEVFRIGPDIWLATTIE